MAQLVTGAIYGGYDRWKQQHGIGVVAVADPAEAAARHRDELRRKKADEAEAKVSQHARAKIEAGRTEPEPAGPDKGSSDSTSPQP